MNTVWNILTRRKVLDTVEIERTELRRVLNWLDLTALGVGSTLGVGVYVLAGHVAKDTAGPAVVLSFLIAAIASVFAGLCYAEFGARTPRAGSAYIYSYVCVGEFIAFIIGWNLILEYVIGSASVAKGLSLYLDTLINNTLQNTFIDIAPINVSFMSPYFDFFAFGVSFILAVALAFGMKESTLVNNIFTLLNLGVVIFVIIAGSIKADPDNWHIPANHSSSAIGDGGFFPFGIEGMIKGAATCFYGFIGFDCIATTGEEVKNPQKAIPVSIILSLFIIFLSYFGTSTVVTLMVPYYLQDPNAPIPHAFDMINWEIAKWIVAIGGIFGLCASLFGAMFPLPRIIYAMASDNLVFRFLGKVNSRFQTPVIGTLLAGILTGLMAALFELKQLVDMMSIGTLLAYTIVAASVLLLREKEQQWYRNRFKILRKHTKELHQSDNSGMHNVLIRRIGPEWYQELSPNQLETVDRFQQCIWSDLIEGTVVNCQENLIELGVVPKFSKKYLRLALNDCNQCPIEFLLILHQLINPKRIDYTLNDRLLLSSVVHLTMRDTLRELHVRIPSPPRKPPRKIRDVNKKRKKVNYESPYLEISTFKPLSRPKGVYANKHIQYPESPYFDYLKSLKDNPCSVEDLNLIEIQILTELEKAQCFYETLFDYEPIPKLLKPSVYSNAELELTDEIIANTPESLHSQEEDMGEEPETEASFEIPEESTEVVQNPNCHCLEKYEEFKEIEIISKRFDLVDKLETSTNKYIIGGIVDTPNGPECLITGCVPKKSPPVCDCLEKYRRKIKENEQRQELVEKLEQSGQKFIIGGIVDTPQGPECLINGCIPKKVPPRCCCMRIYEDYLKEHSNCMKLYEDYLNEINECTNELLDQEQVLIAQNQCKVEKVMESRGTSFDYFPQADTCSYYDPDECLNIQDPDKVENIPEDATTPSENVENSINVPNDAALNTQNLDTVPTTTEVAPERSAVEERNDEILEQNTEQPVQIQIDPHSTVFKRFFIYKKLPNNRKQQISLIKAALKSMADDGYPLARLPDAYKLPHFKLWMQMRCGKFWTQSDRRNYLQKNVQFWNHTEKCRRDVPMLKLPISQERAKELTWRQADYCRKIVNDAKNLYCKRLKEAIIDLGREFYPTTFSYEFPSKVFRNCYFAYIPTREMDVYGKFVWDVSEIKNFTKRKIWQ